MKPELVRMLPLPLLVSPSTALIEMAAPEPAGQLKANTSDILPCPVTENPSLAAVAPPVYESDVQVKVTVSAKLFSRTSPSDGRLVLATITPLPIDGEEKAVGVAVMVMARTDAPTDFI